MSIKKILMSAVCTVFLLVSTASAENKEKVASNGFVFMCDSNQSCRVSVL